MTHEWKRDHEAATDTRTCRIEDCVLGYISQYPDINRYNWQAIRGQFRLTGIEADSDAAIACAEEALALPIEEFNRLVAKDLIDDFQRIERDILLLSPGTKLLPGYRAGYDAGVADIKRKVASALGDSNI